MCQFLWETSACAVGHFRQHNLFVSFFRIIRRGKSSEKWSFTLRQFDYNIMNSWSQSWHIHQCKSNIIYIFAIPLRHFNSPNIDLHVHSMMTISLPHATSQYIGLRCVQASEIIYGRSIISHCSCIKYRYELYIYNYTRILRLSRPFLRHSFIHPSRHSFRPCFLCPPVHPSVPPTLCPFRPDYNKAFHMRQSIISPAYAAAVQYRCKLYIYSDLRGLELDENSGIDGTITG